MRGADEDPDDFRRVLPEGERGVHVDPDLSPRAPCARPRNHAHRPGLSGAVRGRAGDRADRLELPAARSRGSPDEGRRASAPRPNGSPASASTSSTSRPRSWRTTAASNSRGASACRRSRPITRSSRSTCSTTFRSCRRAGCGRRRGASRARQGNSVAALVVPSTAMREVLRGYGVTTPMHVVPTGIPLADFGGGDGARFRAPARHPGRPTPLLLFVGRVAHEKNIGFLLRALELARRQVPDLEMVIAGEGPAEASLRREAARLGLGDQVAFRRLSRPQGRAARLLRGGRRLRVRLAHRDPGPGAARGHGQSACRSCPRR